MIIDSDDEEDEPVHEPLYIDPLILGEQQPTPPLFDTAPLPSQPYGARLPDRVRRHSSARSKVDEDRRTKLAAALHRRNLSQQNYGAMRLLLPPPTTTATTTATSAGETARNSSLSETPTRRSMFTRVSDANRIVKYRSPFKDSVARGQRMAKSAAAYGAAALQGGVHVGVAHRLSQRLLNGLPSSPLADSLSATPKATPQRTLLARNAVLPRRSGALPPNLTDSQSVTELLRHLIKEGSASDFPSWRALQERRRQRMQAIADLRKPRREAINDLTPEQQRTVDAALQSRDLGRTVVSAFRIDISVGDLRTLGDRQWLNDNVIDFYLEMVTDRSRRHAAQRDRQFPKTFCYTTHFFTTLASKGYLGVARWGKRKQLNMGNIDYIFVPINVHNTHWCVSVINIKEKKFEYYDSLGGGPGGAFSHLMEYVANEARTQGVAMDDVDEWETVVAKDSPMQENGYDCGVFTCKTVEVLSRDVALTFSQKDMKRLRRRMVFEIISGKLLT
ncbi:uncharacterized protein V1518DRAFT_371733 [Limtongia smithiae]|uniref:uncharacterized protein n=1 Tax=Limtongia smithiae TaxID=1125753 RepID=UPI0034CF4879